MAIFSNATLTATKHTTVKATVFGRLMARLRPMTIPTPAAWMHTQDQQTGWTQLHARLQMDAGLPRGDAARRPLTR